MGSTSTWARDQEREESERLREDAESMLNLRKQRTPAMEVDAALEKDADNWRSLVSHAEIHGFEPGDCKTMLGRLRHLIWFIGSGYISVGNDADNWRLLISEAKRIGNLRQPGRMDGIDDSDMLQVIIGVLSNHFKRADEIQSLKEEVKRLQERKMEVKWTPVSPTTMPKPGVPVLLKFADGARANKNSIVHRKTDSDIAYGSTINYDIAFLCVDKDGFGQPYPVSFMAYHYKTGGNDGQAVVQHGAIEFKYVSYWAYLQDIDEALCFEGLEVST